MYIDRIVIRSLINLAVVINVLNKCLPSIKQLGKYVVQNVTTVHVKSEKHGIWFLCGVTL